VVEVRNIRNSLHTCCTEIILHCVVATMDDDKRRDIVYEKKWGTPSPPRPRFTTPLVVSRLKVCSQPWTEVEFWTRVFHRSQRTNWLHEWALTVLVSLQPIISWCWRAWPVKCRDVTGSTCYNIQVCSVQFICREQALTTASTECGWITVVIIIVHFAAKWTSLLLQDLWFISLIFEHIFIHLSLFQNYQNRKLYGTSISCR